MVGGSVGHISKLETAMNDADFKKLTASIREAGAIRRGEAESSRVTTMLTPEERVAAIPQYAVSDPISRTSAVAAVREAERDFLLNIAHFSQEAILRSAVMSIIHEHIIHLWQTGQKYLAEEMQKLRTEILWRPPSSRMEPSSASSAPPTASA